MLVEISFSSMTNLFFLLVGVFFASALQPTAAADFRVISGVGYNGADLPESSGGRVRVESAVLCQERCYEWSHDSTKSLPCTLWSYYGNDVSGANCYLKNNQTQITPAPCPNDNKNCSTSGTIDALIDFRVILGVGYNGADLPESDGGRVRVSSPLSCQQHCYDWSINSTKSLPCTLWSYYGNGVRGPNCYLKNNQTHITPAPCPNQIQNCSTSGTINTLIDFRVISGVGYNGADLPSSDGGRVRVSSPVECQQRCYEWLINPTKSSTPCTLWSFYNGSFTGPNCYLKYNTTQVTPVPCPSQNTNCATSGTIIGCPGGYRVSNTSTSCVRCASGSWSIGGISVECKSCPGHTTSPSGSSACLPCPVGTYGEVCLPCPAGTYKNTTGPGSCILCPRGSASSSIGQQTCTWCSSGSYTNITGAQSCTRMCPAGTYYYSTQIRTPPYIAPDSSLASVCTLCPYGFICPITSLHPIQCPLGTFPDVDSTICVPCPPGSDRSSYDRSCQACGPNSYAPFSGTIQCSICTNNIRQFNATQCCKYVVGTNPKADALAKITIGTSSALYGISKFVGLTKDLGGFTAAAAAATAAGDATTAATATALAANIQATLKAIDLGVIVLGLAAVVDGAVNAEIGELPTNTCTNN